MALSIRNEKAERLAREIAAETGQTMTQAVIDSLEERLERLRGRRTAGDLVQDLLAIWQRASALPDQDVRSADEILGYDHTGIPVSW